MQNKKVLVVKSLSKSPTARNQHLMGFIRLKSRDHHQERDETIRQQIWPISTLHLPISLYLPFSGKSVPSDEDQWILSN